MQGEKKRTGVATALQREAEGKEAFSVTPAAASTEQRNNTVSGLSSTDQKRGAQLTPSTHPHPRKPPPVLCKKKKPIGQCLKMLRGVTLAVAVVCVGCVCHCVQADPMSRLIIPRDYGVKLCGREFIRAVIFTCGGSRWRRSTDGGSGESTAL